MTKYIPKVGPKVIPAHIEEKTITGLLNAPEPGTRLRVTLPGTETVIVGTMMERDAKFALIDLLVEGTQNYYDSTMTLWINSGWEFEILPALAQSDYELVTA